MSAYFTERASARRDRCEHCGEAVLRVWLVPGDVLNSCGECFAEATGREPVHEHGHSTQHPAGNSPRASFYLRVDGRRPA